MVNGKQKGNRFEREVAQIFSDRFAGKLGVANGFRRRPDSGAYFGGKNQSRIEDCLNLGFGDIICPDDFLYSIECKSYAHAVGIKSILEQKDKKLDEWIEQASSDAGNAKKLPLLIIKYNLTPVMVLLPVEFPCWIMNYRGWYGGSLEKLLELGDENFFVVQTK